MARSINDDNYSSGPPASGSVDEGEADENFEDLMTCGADQYEDRMRQAGATEEDDAAVRLVMRQFAGFGE